MTFSDRLRYTQNMKYPPPDIYVHFYTTLRSRHLVMSRDDFMRQYAGMARSAYHRAPTPLTLTRLWLSLNAKGQHDLAVVAHEALLARAMDEVTQ
jgi:hypothetical protein